VEMQDKLWDWQAFHLILENDEERFNIGLLGVNLAD
jgi:hypothetical protein